MRLRSLSRAHRVAMCVTLCCQAWLTGCATSAPPVPTLWIPCQRPHLPPGSDLTVRQVEEALLRVEKALADCDAQGRKLLQR